MSLFVGNLSNHVDIKELQEAFEKHGKCKLDMRVGALILAFVRWFGHFRLRISQGIRNLRILADEENVGMRGKGRGSF